MRRHQRQVRHLSQTQTYNRGADRVDLRQPAEKRRVCRTQDFNYQHLIRKYQLLYIFSGYMIRRTPFLKFRGGFIKNRQFQFPESTSSSIRSRSEAFSVTESLPIIFEFHWCGVAAQSGYLAYDFVEGSLPLHCLENGIFEQRNETCRFDA